VTIHGRLIRWSQQPATTDRLTSSDSVSRSIVIGIGPTGEMGGRQPMDLNRWVAVH
jgi:hypothetical protein